MQVCKVCGGTVGYVSSQLAKCEYCGRVYSLNGDTLSEANLEETYKEAVLLSKSEKENDQLAAINIWEAIGSYKDSGIKIQECRNLVSKARIAAEDKRLADLRQAELDEIERKRRESIEKQKKKIIYMTVGIVGVVVVLGIAITTISSSMKKSKYEEAVALYESKQYDEALILFKELDNYSDASGYATNAMNSITERENAYKKGIGYFDAGMYSNAINELSPIVDYLDVQEYIQKSATNLYEQAVADYEAEDYSGSKEKLMIIPQNCNEYIQGNTLLTEIEEILLAQQKQDSYNQALDAYEGGEYDTAQRLFVELGDYEDSKKYLETIGTSFYEQAQELYNAENYVECGDVLQHIDTVEEWTEYSIAVALKQNASDAYVDIIREEAKSICRRQGETEMRQYLSDMSCSLLSQSELDNLKGECVIKTVSLTDLQPYVSKGIEIWEQTKDNYGNLYEVVMENGVGTDWGDAYYSYIIDGKYKYFIATGAAWESSGSSFSDGIIKIYGDDRLLWSDNTIGVGKKPVEIQVDISGVEDLRVEVYGHYGINSSSGNCMLCNPMLSE